MEFSSALAPPSDPGGPTGRREREELFDVLKDLVAEFGDDESKLLDIDAALEKLTHDENREILIKNAQDKKS